MKNEWRSVWIGIVALVLVAGGAGFHYWYTQDQGSQTPPVGEVAGESDGASIPDGTPVTQTVKLSGTVHIAGVQINPVEVVEESRCPTDVQCIQAGTVRVRAMVVERGGTDPTPQPALFELGVPLTIALDQVTLVDVKPAPHSGSSITPGDYVFTFTVVKGAGTEYFKG